MVISVVLLVGCRVGLFRCRLVRSRFFFVGVEVAGAGWFGSGDGAHPVTISCQSRRVRGKRVEH